MDTHGTTPDNETGRTTTKQWLIIAGLAVYTGLLLLGTIGELFDIGWIKDLPIFRGP